MPRLGVNFLRWLLFAVNLTALAGLGFLSFRLFFPGAGGQLRISLPDPAGVAVSAEVRETFDPKVLNQILRIHKDAPRAKPDPRPVETAPPPLVEGGPLSGWEVAMSIFAEGRRCASLQEKVQQSIVPNAPQTRVAPPDPRGGRVRAGSSRPRVAPTRRAPPPTNMRTKWVIEGNEFKLDGNAYQALRITARPSELEYRDLATGRSYKLSGATAAWQGYEPGEQGGIMLRGLSDEELGLDPAAQNPLAAAQNAAAQEERGEVKRAEPAAPNARTPAPAADESRRRQAEEEREKLREIERMKIPEDQRKEIQEALGGSRGGGAGGGEKPQ